jgi:replication factor C subunit 2/4
MAVAPRQRLNAHIMAKAESSKAAASNGIKANPNAQGGANYELPW